MSLEEASIEEQEKLPPPKEKKPKSFISVFFMGFLLGAILIIGIDFLSPPQQSIKEWADLHDCLYHVTPEKVISYYPILAGQTAIYTTVQQASTVYDGCTLNDGTNVTIIKTFRK